MMKIQMRSESLEMCSEQAMLYTAEVEAEKPHSLCILDSRWLLSVILARPFGKDSLSGEREHIPSPSSKEEKVKK